MKPKIFFSNPNIFKPLFFWTPNSFGHQFFSDPKVFVVLSDSNFFWDPKFFLPQFFTKNFRKIEVGKKLGSKTIWGSKKSRVQINLSLKKIWGPTKNLGSEKD